MTEATFDGWHAMRLRLKVLVPAPAIENSSAVIS